MIELSKMSLSLLILIKDRAETSPLYHDDPNRARKLQENNGN